MKVKLNFSFAYYEKQKNEQKKTIINLLRSFAEFCDNTWFEFQSIPGIGEDIVAEDLIRKWLESKRYKKNNPDNYVWKEIYSGLTTGTFVVEKVCHSLDTCTVFCSDIAHRENK